MSSLKQYYFSFFPSLRFYGGLGLGVVLLILSYFFPALYFFAKLFLVLLGALTLLETALLYSGNHIKATRNTPERLSNGDPNPIKVNIDSIYAIPVQVKVIDELPVQLQVRQFEIQDSINSNSSKTIEYLIYPKSRGNYAFGKLHVFASCLAGLIERRFSFEAAQDLACYPSYLQLRQFEFLAISNRLQDAGIKKIRRLGHHYEFEKIKDYVPGDDIRTVNWKATARRSKLMVNLYEDEKSQQVYSILDLGRVMRNPFNGMTLLDYAINTSLVLSSIAINKYDKAGLIAFDHANVDILPADRRSGQMRKIQEKLYKVDTHFLESDFERLYLQIRHKLNQRSLLVLYTNFDTVNSMRRHLPFLRFINKRHLLLLVFFKDTQLEAVLEEPVHKVSEVYVKTVAEKFQFEKQLIVDELRKEGIMSILSRPEDLSANTLNKYLELKSRGLL
ncbi:MAG: DUF58 domain-containing protein [Bacteroidetes bacterium]|nr:MAG: DUF58 domain-containing protein [Bacteroidota bacterium]